MKPELINRIYLSEIIDPLFAREVINEEDKDEIESAEKNRGPLEATRILLNKVDKRLPNWDTEFADVLEKAGMAEIADIFKMVEHHTHIDERGKKNIRLPFLTFGVLKSISCLSLQHVSDR